MTDQPAAAPKRTAPWSLVLVALAVALVSLAVAVASLLLGDDGDRLEQARESALAAARERTLALTSYDHRTLDADFAAVEKTATGAFAQEYEKTTEQLRATFEQSQATATSQVVGAGLESLQLDADGGDRAVAVVAVDQVIRTAGAQPRTERNRLRMVLVRPEDTWLVAEVTRL